MPATIYETAIIIVIAICSIALFYLLSACSTTAERFDQRPQICKDIGKRGKEC